MAERLGLPRRVHEPGNGGLGLKVFGVVAAIPLAIVVVALWALFRTRDMIARAVKRKRS